MAATAAFLNAVLDYDTQLMCAATRGDDASFCLLVQRHRTQLVQHLSRLVQNQAVAEELAQDVFLRVHRSRAAWTPSAKFTTWLFRVSTNVAYNHFRDQRHHNSHISLDSDTGTGTRKPDFPDPAGSVEHTLVADVRANQIRAAIAALPWKQRSAVLMHKYEELDYSQIAHVLGCTPSAVKALMFRAYETLRGQLAHLGS